MGLSHYLRAVLAARKSTSAALAKELGLNPTYLYRWIDGKGFPNEKQLLMLCRYFSVSADEILEFKGASEGKLPILATVDCGQFNPAILASHGDVEWISVPKELLSEGPRTSAGKGDAFALRPRGDSMEPTVTSKTVLVLRVPRKNEVPELDAIVAATFDLQSDPPKAAIKSLRSSADGKMAVLESLNPQYSPIVRPSKEIRIEGIVTGIISARGIRITGGAGR